MLPTNQYSSIKCHTGAGYVAFIISEGRAEIYSPNGWCNYRLAEPPIETEAPVLAFANNRIIACEGMKSCWEYNSQNDEWRNLIRAPYEAMFQPGVVLKNKLYVIDESNVHALDLINNVWSTGPKPPVDSGNASWTVAWKDSIILLGGNSNFKGVQMYNVKSQTWAVRSSANVPFEMNLSPSLLTGPNQVLVAGSERQKYRHSTATYNPQTDSWLSLPNFKEDLLGTRLVQLGSRIFAIDGAYTDNVVEFSEATSTWSLVGVRPLNKYQGYHSVVAVPASLFAHYRGGCRGVL